MVEEYEGFVSLYMIDDGFKNGMFSLHSRAVQWSSCINHCEAWLSSLSLECIPRDDNDFVF
jgi:hypothetical protein